MLDPRIPGDAPPPPPGPGPSSHLEEWRTARPPGDAQPATGPPGYEGVYLLARPRRGQPMTQELPEEVVVANHSRWSSRRTRGGSLPQATRAPASLDRVEALLTVTDWQTDLLPSRSRIDVADEILSTRRIRASSAAPPSASRRSTGRSPRTLEYARPGHPYLEATERQDGRTAIHPSVRLTRATAWFSVKGCPNACCKYWTASSSLSRRSAALTSFISPRPAAPQATSAGPARVDKTSAAGGG